MKQTKTVLIQQLVRITLISPSDSCEFEDALPTMIISNPGVGRMIRSKISEDIVSFLA